jgi:site-specific recombinase XerD
MKTLRQAVNDYLMMRRSLGFKLYHVERDLESFVSFMEREKAPHIAVDLALRWAMQPSRVHAAYWAQRLSAVRGFAQYWSAIDAHTQVPPGGLLPFPNRRAKPYLYTEEDIQRLMTAAKSLRPRDGLRGWTYHCLLGLLTVTGLRISELIGLERRDVSLQEGLLTIRGTKFGKVRLVPLHVYTRDALTQYAQLRDAYLDGQKTVKFLVSDHGRPLKASSVRRTFYHLSRQTGLRAAGDRNGPRLHDFRHRFATESLLRWCRSGEDIARMLPALATYLGHSNVRDTYWYLSTCPELMGHATRRLEKRWEVRS